jgi:hypothetical protein
VVTSRLCRVCKGVKGGYFPEGYRRCKGQCKGNGRIKITITDTDICPNFRPCGNCGGWGWAKP